MCSLPSGGFFAFSNFKLTEFCLLQNIYKVSQGEAKGLTEPNEDLTEEAVQSEFEKIFGFSTGMPCSLILYSCDLCAQWG